MSQCYAKAYDIVICEADDPRLADNPPRYFGDDAALKAAITKVSAASKYLYGDRATKGLRAALREIPVQYNGRLSKAIGRCMVVYYRKPPPPWTNPELIEISSKYDIPDDYIPGLLIHEYCHAVRALLSADYQMEEGHGLEWQDLMIASGESADPKCADPRMLQQYATTRALRGTGSRRRAIDVGVEGLSREDVSRFDVVKFVSTSTRHKKNQKGIVARLGSKRATIQTRGGVWRVPYSQIVEVLEHDADPRPFIPSKRRRR